MTTQRRSLLQQIFGDEIGGMIQIMAILPIFMLLMSGMIYGVNKLTKPDPQTTLLSQLPKDSQDLIKELATVQLKTQKLISKLETDSSNAERLLHDKQQVLEDLKKKIALLQLTPEQRAVVEQYNSTLTNDMELMQWLKQKTTWYNVVSATLISWFFYWLGVRQGKKVSLVEKQT